MAEPTGTISPTPPSASPLMDRIYNYINQPLNTEDPIQNLVSGVADFIPGISTELAKRRGDKFGEALSYLDVVGGGLSAEAISFAARRAGLIKKLKREQEILAKETDPSEIAAAQTEITKLQKQIKKMDADNVPSKKPKTFDEIGTKPPSYQEIVERENKRISDELFGVDLDKGFADTPKDMLRDMQADYIKSRKGPTEIPPVLYDRRSIDDTSLDFDKAFLRGEYTTRGSNPNFNKPGSIQFTGEKLPMRYTYSDSYAKYMNDPKKLKELKLATGPDLRYSTEIDPTLIQDAFSGQYPELTRLFHGSKTKNIKNLELPTGQGSSGGIYSLVDPKDPRFKIYSEGGSGYVLKPNLKNPLDIDNIPNDFLKKLEDLQMVRGRPSRDLSGGIGDLMKNNKIDFQLDTMLRGGPGSINKKPSGLSKEVADIFTREGYDSLRFPPRGMKGEGSTMLSLDPNNLEIINEIDYKDLDDFIRQLLSE